MQYRIIPKNGDCLSALGYGGMRFPKKFGKIDEERAIHQIRSAINMGVNYIDTAFTYGESEQLIGKALQDGYKEKVKIATKMPPWNLKKYEDMNIILEKQLKNLKTDHIDYYLLHSLDANNWKKFLELDVLKFLENSKKEGKTINIGFSFHGDIKTFKEIIDAYDWTFCQIQYNFLDEDMQAGKEGLKYAASKNLGIIVMEPLRGGMLTQNLPNEVKNIYDDSKIQRSAAQWGLRWVWNHPEVTVVLSGMNDENHIKENIATCEDAFPNSCTSDEILMINRVKIVYHQLLKVGCTGCSYCMPCPFGVNIPQCFFFYNQYYMADTRIITRGRYGMKLLDGLGDNPSNASLCKDCGKCRDNCPQKLTYLMN